MSRKPGRYVLMEKRLQRKPAMIIGRFFPSFFFDFYLFENLYGLDKRDVETRAPDYLNRLQLSHKVQINDGKLSGIELSQGQRKRLALLSAYLEDRSFYVFDEWAAD